MFFKNFIPNYCQASDEVDSADNRVQVRVAHYSGCQSGRLRILPQLGQNVEEKSQVRQVQPIFEGMLTLHSFYVLALRKMSLKFKNEFEITSGHGWFAELIHCKRQNKMLNRF